MTIGKEIAGGFVGFLYVRVAGPRPSYQIFNPDNSLLLDQLPAAQEYRGSSGSPETI